MNISTLPIQAITWDLQCQPRAFLDRDVIDQYAEEMSEGAIFPPVVVFHEGDDHWLADGFHRVAAAKQAGLDAVNCEVREGTIRDAMLYGVGANATHGLQRTNEDKRQAVKTLIDDPEWSQWSDREIARRCAVSHTFVQNFKKSLAILASDNQSQNVKYSDRWGNTRTMNTANLGKRLDAPPLHVTVVQTDPPWPIRVPQAPQFTLPRVPPITVKRPAPATPAECQAVVAALESLFTSMERADGGRIGFTDVMEYVLAESDRETRADFLTQSLRLASDMRRLGDVIAKVKGKIT